jgi:hypothetical protein
MKKKIVSVEEVPCDDMIYDETDPCFNTFYKWMMGKQYNVTYDDGSVEFKYQCEL